MLYHTESSTPNKSKGRKLLSPLSFSFSVNVPGSLTPLALTLYTFNNPTFLGIASTFNILYVHYVFFIFLNLVVLLLFPPRTCGTITNVHVILQATSTWVDIQHGRVWCCHSVPSISNQNLYTGLIKEGGAGHTIPYPLGSTLGNQFEYGFFNPV